MVVEHVRFACECGRRFRVRPAATARSVRCPDCGERVLVPHGAPRPCAQGPEHDLEREAHVRALAIRLGLTAPLALLAALFFLVAASGHPKPTAPFGLLGAVSLLLGVGYGAAALGLVRLRPWGRALAAGLTALALAVACLEAAISGAGIGLITHGLWFAVTWWAVMGPRGARLFTPAYAAMLQLRSPDARPRWWASPVFYLPLVALGAVLLMALYVAGR